VTDKPILFSARPLGAKPKTGYDFAIIDSRSTPTVRAPARWPPRRSRSEAGAFVVEDYAGELVRLTSVARAK
jgi:hypothetical protein